MTSHSDPASGAARLPAGKRTARTARAMLPCIASVLVLDQATKTLSAVLGPVPPFLRPVRNNALSLGILDLGGGAEVLLMAAGLLTAAVLLSTQVSRWRVTPACAGLMLGGAAGNLIDRAVLGSVRDFFVLGPVIVNLADLAVLLGLLLAVTSRPRTDPAPKLRAADHREPATTGGR